MKIFRVKLTELTEAMGKKENTREAIMLQSSLNEPKCYEENEYKVKRVEKRERRRKGRNEGSKARTRQETNRVRIEMQKGRADGPIERVKRTLANSWLTPAAFSTLAGSEKGRSTSDFQRLVHSGKLSPRFLFKKEKKGRRNKKRKELERI